MKQALRMAKIAASCGEVPIGAVLVNADGFVVARSRNAVQKNADPLGHAEIRLIRRFAKKMKDWRLDGCTMYVTLEPCCMCMQAIIRSRIGRLVYAASSPVYGFMLDKFCSFKLEKCPIIITSQVSSAESERLLKDFFKQKRDVANGKRKKNSFS